MPCRAGLLERMRVQIAAYGTSELYATLGGVGVLGGTPAVDCLWHTRGLGPDGCEVMNTTSAHAGLDAKPTSRFPSASGIW